MLYTKKLDLPAFEFWAGALDNQFTYSELKQLESILDDVFRDTLPTETDVNDMFWFEEERLCHLLDIKYGEYLKRDSKLIRSTDDNIYEN